MLLIQLTGLSGAGKTTLARVAEQKLVALGYKVEVIDGDEYRSRLCGGLGFSKADRIENIRRLGFVGCALARHGVIVLLAAINPYQEARESLQKAHPFVRTVYVACPLPVLKKRDVKGLYERAMLPEGHPERLEQFTGVSDPYEIPVSPDLTLQTDTETPDKSAQRLVNFIMGEINPATPVEPRPKALFIGRWQPFHRGHRWLIDQKLRQGIPVLIAVRDVPLDEKNPYSAEQTMEMIRRVYAGQPVEVIAIPDIESVNYGRGVGYEVNCFTPPDDVGAISGTAIRKHIRDRSDGWKEYVDGEIQSVVLNGDTV